MLSQNITACILVPLLNDRMTTSLLHAQGVIPLLHSELKLFTIKITRITEYSELEFARMGGIMPLLKEM